MKGGTNTYLLLGVILLLFAGVFFAFIFGRIVLGIALLLGVAYIGLLILEVLQ